MGFWDFESLTLWGLLHCTCLLCLYTGQNRSQTRISSLLYWNAPVPFTTIIIIASRLPLCAPSLAVWKPYKRFMYMNLIIYADFNIPHSVYMHVYKHVTSNLANKYFFFYIYWLLWSCGFILFAKDILHLFPTFKSSFW